MQRDEFYIIPNATLIIEDMLDDEPRIDDVPDIGIHPRRAPGFVYV